MEAQDEHPWSVRLSAAAQADFSNILRWTQARFGDQQARSYSDTLIAALTALASGPSQPGVKRRDDIGDNLFTLHIARNYRKGRHFILFRIKSGNKAQVIEVLRLLHDAMDFKRHLPDEA